VTSMALVGVTLLASSIAVPPEPPTEALDRALECRAYTDMAKAVHADDPRMVAMDERLHSYWVRRSNELGRRAGLSDEAISLRQLIIPLEADRFRPVMIRCLEQTPRSALR
jgi:hypothetical protein